MTNTELLELALIKCRYNKALLGRKIGIKSRSFIHNILSGGRPLPDGARRLLYEFMEGKDEVKAEPIKVKIAKRDECRMCNGHGYIETGIEESPSTICNFCDGFGYKD